jgi:TDG/mug DNA glycosylase family protein
MPRASSSSPSSPLPLLRDRIAPGVRVLFVGINPGVRSSLLGHNFAGHSNRFWKLMREAQLVPEGFSFADDDRLPEFGFGMTNLIARPTPGINDLTPAEYKAGRDILLKKIARFAPEVVALIGVTLARSVLPTVAKLGVGLQTERLADAAVFVLPNPSGRNAHYSYAMMLDAFRSLKSYLDTTVTSR